MPIVRFITRFIGLIIAVFLFLPIVLAIIVYSQKTNNRQLNEKIVNLWSKTLCFIFGLRLIHQGKIQTNPVLIVANHVSWLDIPVINCYKLTGFVAKAEIANWPVLGWMAKCGESLFIARGKQESRQKVLEGIKSRLKTARSIAVFPEGKATDGKTLGRFHRQLMHAAIEEQKPIQAIAIKYLTPQGHRNSQICFREESFVVNVFRILSLPTSIVELTFCEVIVGKEITARTAAEKTHSQVAQVLAENDYL